MAVRTVTMVAHPMCSSPRSAASSGETSQKNSGCSSDRYGTQRDIPPAVWCSVSRYVVQTYGKISLPGCPPDGFAMLCRLRSTCRAGFDCWPYSGFVNGDSCGS